MKITGFKKTKNNQYELILDNGELITLFDEIILKYELLITKEIDKKKLKVLLGENELIDGYFVALKLIATKLRSKLELKQLLCKKEFSQSAIEFAISRLENEGYLNEKMYVSAFINDSLNLSMNGPIKIATLLKEKGISLEEIEKHLEGIDNKIWEDKINKLIAKKEKTNKKGMTLFKNKLYIDLIHQGYSNELISYCLDKYNFNQNNTFEKEADKIWNNLNKKYNDKELILKFKNKMYTRGFNTEEIQHYINNKEN